MRILHTLRRMASLPSAQTTGTMAQRVLLSTRTLTWWRTLRRDRESLPSVAMPPSGSLKPTMASTCCGMLTRFAISSLHTITIVGKQLINAFYGKKQDKSYYIGCSLGGRQGIKAAEVFPDDFDGIFAGTPAVDFNNLYSWRASFFPITSSVNSPDFINPSTWETLIHDEVLRQCDGLDGVMDGIIQDPNLCAFRPEAIMCTANNSTDCLTPIQVEKVRQIFSPLYGEDGNLIYPAMQPGSEIVAATGLYAGVPWFFSQVSERLWDVCLPFPGSTLLRYKPRTGLDMPF